MSWRSNRRTRPIRDRPSPTSRPSGGSSPTPAATSPPCPKEIQLAKCELKVSVKNGGTGVGPVRRRGVLRADGRWSCSPWGWPTSSTGTARGSTCSGRSCWCSCSTCWSPRCSGYLGYRKVQKVRGPEKAIAEAQKTKTALTDGRERLSRSRRAQLGAVLRVGRRSAAADAPRRRLRDLLGRQGVAGLGVGQRRGEHQTRPRRRPRTRPARPSCPGGPCRAARARRG